MRTSDGSVRAGGQRRPWRLAGIGLTVALGFAGLDDLGVFTGVERKSVDFRMAALPRPARPMSREVVHIDIDDSALDRIGRWPWDRAILADAVDELARAGAATVALDLLLTEAQPAAPGTAPDLTSDQRFADALARTRAVVPVLLHEPPQFGQAWRHGSGPSELERLLRALSEDIQRNEHEVAERAGVTGDRRRRFVERPLAFKQAAAWHDLRRASPPDWTTFENRLTPNRSAIAGDYAERDVLRSVWTQHQAWKILKPRLIRFGDQETPGTHQDAAPLPAIAASAHAVGFVNVNARKHPDGRVRELPVFRGAPGGTAVQFGVAAALAHRGIDPVMARAEDDHFVAGNVRLPLRDGQLWIAWPTSRSHPRWKGLLDRTGRADGTDGHLSIREVVELARARRTREGLRTDLAGVTKLVFAGAEITFDDGDLLGDEARRLAADEVDFTISEALPGEAIETDHNAAFRDHIHNCTTWRELDRAISEADARIADASFALRAAVAGRLVFVGWTATGVAADFCATAIGPSTPGVTVHAALADMVLTGHCVHFLPQRAGIWLILLPAVACVLLAARCSALVSTIGASGIVLVYAATAVVLFVHFDLAIPVVAPLTAASCVWIAGTAIDAWLSQRDRRQITRQFKSRVSGDLVDFLVANPGAVTVNGVEREVTVLFGDLAGFTSMSESLGGPRTVAMLNRYLARLAGALVDNGAYVNKFLGDGFMAFWSAFEPDPEQARRACASIAACRAAMDELNEESRSLDLPELDLRIGIATGRVVVGDCGAPPLMHDYTVIGDAVNLSARLESANKQFGTTNLIDGRTRELLGEDSRGVRPVGRISVVGQTAQIETYEVMPPGCSEAMVDLCRRVVDSFTDGRLGEAGDALSSLESSFGPTKWSSRYRRAIDDVDDTDAFDGTLRLSEK